MTAPEWKSPRKLAEEQAAAELEAKQARYKAFDRLVDLALDGQIELGEAIEAYRFDGELYAPKENA